MFERKHKLLATALAAGAALSYAGAAAVQADTINVLSDPNDYQIDQAADDSTSTGEVNSDTVVVGQQNDLDHNAVFIFALPRIGAGNSVTTGTLALNHSGTNNAADTGDGTKLQGDLYGIENFPNSNAPIDAFYEGGPNNTASQQLLKGAFLSNAGAMHPNDLSRQDSTMGSNGGSTQEDIATYLNEFYSANPAYTGGNYVFLRINGRGEVTQNANYELSTADRTGTDLDPQLTIETANPVPAVPEPASLALLGLGGLAMLGRRRRRA